MKFKYAGPDVGPIGLTDLSSSIVAGPSGIEFQNIVSQNQIIESGPNTIELQDSDEVIKSFKSGQLKALVDAGTLIVEVPPIDSFDYTPAAPPDWGITTPSSIPGALDTLASLIAGYVNGTASSILLADGSSIGDATHRLSNVFLESIDSSAEFNLIAVGASRLKVDALRTLVDQNLIVSGDLSIGTLSGLLKATAGLVSGGATTADLTEDPSNLYYTDTRARLAQSATAPLIYDSGTGAHSLAGLSSLGSTNNIVGVNLDGTGWEYKSIVGLSSDHVTVTHGVNSITLSLPQALGITSNVTFATVETSGSASILGATPSTSPTTGALIVSGGTGIAGDLNVGGNAEITGELTVGSFTLAGSFSLSGLNLSSVIKNTDYSLTDGDYTVEFNCGVNNLVATLPASPDVGQIYNICKGDNGMGFVTLQGNGYTINGVPSRSTAVQYFVWTIQFNGVEWRIL